MRVKSKTDNGNTPRETFNKNVKTSGDTLKSMLNDIADKRKTPNAHSSGGSWSSMKTKTSGDKVKSAVAQKVANVVPSGRASYRDHYGDDITMYSQNVKPWQDKNIVDDGEEEYDNRLNRARVESAIKKKARGYTR